MQVVARRRIGLGSVMSCAAILFISFSFFPFPSPIFDLFLRAKEKTRADDKAVGGGNERGKERERRKGGKRKMKPRQKKRGEGDGRSDA